jgi:tRNA (guanine-N7-)-methyltransferase
MTDPSSPVVRPLRSFGRIKARTLKPRQQGLIHTLLPHLAVDVAEPIDPRTLFPEAERVVVEIGFGGGEHLAAQAAAYPGWGFIGVEPFLNGMGSCLRHIEEGGLQNVRLHLGDARDVLGQLPERALDLVFILFPDPWPKTKHHKRRLIQPDFVAELARVVKPGGEVRFATDWANYAAWTLEAFSRDDRFVWSAEEAADWRNPWDGHVTTRYEAKGLGDLKPVFLRFERKSSV